MIPVDTVFILKALGSAAATTGSVAMFHAVGSTPEAPTAEAAFDNESPQRELKVTMSDVRAARDRLSTSHHARLQVVCLGTPHYSVGEFELLVDALSGRSIHPDLFVYVSTGRDVLHEIESLGWANELTQAGIQLVTDTCTYITPVMADISGVAMTDSAKWAYYAPGNLGVDVVFGSLEDCVNSAVLGEISRDEAVWADD